MAAGLETVDRPTLEAMLGPQLTVEQARSIFAQGQEAVIFALLTLAKRLSETVTPAPPIDPAAPSAQTPPYLKPARKGRAKNRGARPGHTGQRRPPPTTIDRREEHTLTACPACQGSVTLCSASRTRIIEDIPETIQPVVTEHTIRRYWCGVCRKHVEPTVPDALPGSQIGLRVGVLSAFLHYLLGTTLSQIIDVFNFHLH